MNPQIKYAGLATVLLVLVCCAGCSSHRRTQSELKFIETRELDLPYGEAYTAGINGLFGLGYQIIHSDKQSGVISGQVGDSVLRSEAGRRKKKNYDVYKISLLLTPRGPDRTQLRMKLLVNEQPRLDRKVMTQIWQAIDREAMLDAPPPGRR